MTSIFFEGLQFYGYHGVPAEERAVGHRYEVDLWLQLRADPKGDSLDGSVDYAAAMALVHEIGTKRQFHTVEALAAAVLDEVISKYAKVEEATIRVSKLLPPAPFVAERAGVELTRSRSATGRYPGAER